MSKLTFTGFIIPLLLLFTSFEAHSRNPATKNSPGNQLQHARRSLDEGGNGTLQKMIVENGSVTMDLDLNRLNGISSVAARPVTLHFAVAANSFFTILVFNDLLRGPEPGALSLVQQNSTAAVNAAGYSLPLSLNKSIPQLAVEKLPADAAFDLTVRDAKTSFTYFNIQGHQYDYDARAQLLSVKGGRLLLSTEFATVLGRPSDAGALVGRISIGAVMQAVEITQLVQGQPKSVVMPPLNGAASPRTPSAVPGPDVIVGDISDVAQYGTNGNLVGVGVGTTSCNNGDQPIDWYALSDTRHPVIPQNLYRMSGGTNNNDRFEQIGQSWLKHAFLALEDNQCGFGCNTSGCIPGDQLCPGCSDTYDSGLNASQGGLGSRAWVNPFTAVFPTDPANHSGHSHTGTSHRVTVATSDLDPSQNPGAAYFAEGQYVSPTEYTWCQAQPGQCNMYNNVSYRQYNVNGSPPNFTFSANGATARMQPAIMAWAGTGATVNQVQPDPGNDGIWFIGYKVTNPTQGVWHYEYALYNENLDRAIQSFSVPVGAGVGLSNIAFHAPPQEPGWANDGTFMNQGYSSTPWSVTQASGSISWASETFAQNQNANAIRFGTLYNFRFDSDQAPHITTATVGFFKTGSPMPVVIQAPVLADATPTPTPTASPSTTPTPTSTTTPTPTVTPCDTGLIVTGGFETGSFPPWVIDGHSNDPIISTNFVHSGTHSAFAGGNPQQSTYCEENSNEPLGDSSFYQQFTVPPGTSTLSFWHKDCTNDSIAFDWQDAYITNSNGNILQTIYHLCDGADWTNVTVDMTPYAGQTVRIRFLTHQDGFNPPGDTTGQWVDDVVLYQPCGTPTPSPTPTT